MKSEAVKGKLGVRVAVFGVAMGFVLLSSLGIVSRHAASSKAQIPVAIAPDRALEAPAATAQANEDRPEQHLKGHSEIVLQCD